MGCMLCSDPVAVPDPAVEDLRAAMAGGVAASAGWSLVWEGNRAIVASVAPGGPTEEAHIRVGDIVESIDENSLTDRLIYEQQRNSWHAGKRIQVSFLRESPEGLLRRTQGLMLQGPGTNKGPPGGGASERLCGDYIISQKAIVKPSPYVSAAGQVGFLTPGQRV
eukprot:Hpha_TRINITY_DN7914_c0_g1::TRINITY_DN7914_c0_g1_i1::g.146007::m.146007